MKDDSVYIKRILDAISKIGIFSDGMTEEVFKDTLQTQSAIIMQLIIIGELAKKISLDTKDKIKLPWKDIIGFRDKCVHDYYDVDLVIVWSTVMNDIPLMKKALQEYGD